MALKIRQHVIKTKSIAGTPVACHCCDAGCSKGSDEEREEGGDRKRKAKSTESEPHMKQEEIKERKNKKQ